MTRILVVPERALPGTAIEKVVAVFPVDILLTISSEDSNIPFWFKSIQTEKYAILQVPAACTFKLKLLPADTLNPVEG